MGPRQSPGASRQRESALLDLKTSPRFSPVLPRFFPGSIPVVPGSSPVLPRFFSAPRFSPVLPRFFPGSTSDSGDNVLFADLVGGIRAAIFRRNIHHLTNKRPDFDFFQISSPGDFPGILGPTVKFRFLGPKAAKTQKRGNHRKTLSSGAQGPAKAPDCWRSRAPAFFLDKTRPAAKGPCGCAGRWGRRRVWWSHC